MNKGRRTDVFKGLYLADQKDRSRGVVYFQKHVSLIKKRDKGRMARLKSLIQKNKIENASDLLHAAMLFQHGRDPEDYAMAHALALESYKRGYIPKKGEPHPLWLAAAARDRWLLNIGFHQDFGTQYKVKKDLTMELYPVNPKITNRERKKWHVPPLKSKKVQKKDSN